MALNWLQQLVTQDTGLAVRIRGMTWSIVARIASGAFGVAIASRFLRRRVCPHARSGGGALSTQALVNRSTARAASEDLMAQGVAAPEAVQSLIGADEGRDNRQLHLIDAAGALPRTPARPASTGAGYLAGVGHSVAGNMLAGPKVIRATAAATKHSLDLAFAELRPSRRLDAGEAAGGDKRGRPAAALIIHTTENYPFPEPARGRPRSARGTATAPRQKPPSATSHSFSCLPRRARPAGITDRALIEATIERYCRAHQRTERKAGR